MPNMSKLVQSSSPPIPPQVFTATKQWVYDISEKVSRSHAEGNFLFQTNIQNPY